MKNEKMVISIGRECGSGECEIGKKLAQHYGIKFYDNNFIDLLAEMTNQNLNKLAKLEEKVAGHILPVQKNGFDTGRGELMNKMSKNDQLFLQERSLIKQLAASESFVIIGRAANAILADDPSTLRIFVYASMDFKLPRVKEYYHLDTDNEAMRKMKQVDKARREYFEYYSNMTWGSGDAHDFMIDSSIFGIDGTVEAIINMAERKFNQASEIPSQRVQPERNQRRPKESLQPGLLPL